MTNTVGNIMNGTSFLMKRSGVQESLKSWTKIPAGAGMTKKLNIVITTK